MSFDPATPLTAVDSHPAHSPQRLRSHSTAFHHLTFSSSDEDSPVRTNTPDSSPLHGKTEPPSLVQHHIDYHHTSPGTDDSFQDTSAKEENFPTAPPDDNIWLEDPVPDRHLCIHEQSQPHYQYSYPCPYRLNLPQSAPEDAPAPYYEMMDLSNISDF